MEGHVVVMFTEPDWTSPGARRIANLAERGKLRLVLVAPGAKALDFNLVSQADLVVLRPTEPEQQGEAHFQAFKGPGDRRLLVANLGTGSEKLGFIGREPVQWGRMTVVPSVSGNANAVARFSYTLAFGARGNLPGHAREK